MRALMDYLPEKYRDSRETVAFQEAIQPELDTLQAARDDFLSQLNPRTATGWGLELWEDALGLRPSASATLDDRRTRVVVKLRGTGTVTAEMLKTVVESFPVGDVEVVERPRDYWVDIYFTVPDMSRYPSEQDMVDALLEIFPAHLGLTLYYCTFREYRGDLWITFSGDVGSRLDGAPDMPEWMDRIDLPVEYRMGMEGLFPGGMPDAQRAISTVPPRVEGIFCITHTTSKLITEEDEHGQV